MKYKKNISSFLVRIKPTTCCVYSRTLVQGHNKDYNHLPNYQLVFIQLLVLIALVSFGFFKYDLIALGTFLFNFFIDIKILLQRHIYIRNYHGHTDYFRFLRSHSYIFYDLCTKMARKKIELFIDIDNESEFEYMLKHNLDRLICK